MGKFLIYIFIAAAVYFGNAFIQGDFNGLNWSDDDRYYTVLFIVFFWYIIYTKDYEI